MFKCRSTCSCFCKTQSPKRDGGRKKKKKTVCLSVCCCCSWHGPAWHASGASISHLAMSYHYLCLLLSDESAPAPCWGAGALFNGLFQPWFARRKPLTNPFKEGSMDFMAPRALSPSFNKVKSKALSICQWARGTLDAAVFNPRDATVHCMFGRCLIAEPPCRALTWGLFSLYGRADLLLHRWG